MDAGMICRNIVLTFDARMSRTLDPDNAVAPAISDGTAAIANDGVHLYVAADRQAVQRLQQRTVRLQEINTGRNSVSDFAGKDTGILRNQSSV